MLDINTLRADVQAVAARLADRGYTFDVAQFEALEAERKNIQTETQELQARRNALSKQIGQLKAKKEDASALMAEVNAQADQLKSLEAKLEDVQQRLNDFLLNVPNVPHDSVPAGRDADANQEARRVGEPRKLDFSAKDHVDIGEGLGLIDFETATKIARARFVLMKGGLARLHRGLAQFMLDVHTQEHGYTEVYAPYLVNAESIAQMRDGVMIVNTSRGAVIDTQAVIAGLKSGKVGHLGLDVYEEEADLFFEDLSNEVIPDDTLSRLLTFPNVVITGHQAFFTRDAMHCIAETTLRNIADIERTGNCPNAVTAVQR